MLGASHQQMIAAQTQPGRLLNLACYRAVVFISFAAPIETHVILRCHLSVEATELASRQRQRLERVGPRRARRTAHFDTAHGLGRSLQRSSPYIVPLDQTDVQCIIILALYVDRTYIELNGIVGVSYIARRSRLAIAATPARSLDRSNAIAASSTVRARRTSASDRASRPRSSCFIKPD